MSFAITLGTVLLVCVLFAGGVAFGVWYERCQQRTDALTRKQSYEQGYQQAIADFWFQHNSRDQETEGL